VDYQVEFTLATKHQIREIFIRMYYDEEETPGKIVTSNLKIKREQNGKVVANGSATHTNGHAIESKKPHSNGHSRGSSEDSLHLSTLELLKPLLAVPHAQYTREELESLAEAFVEKVPQDAFSPAEVQNFLIPRKKDPSLAVDEAQKWFEAMMKQKEAKKKSEEEALISLEPTSNKETVKHDSPMQSDNEGK
jgi:chaperone BCS1